MDVKEQNPKERWNSNQEGTHDDGIMLCTSKKWNWLWWRRRWWSHIPYVHTGVEVSKKRGTQTAPKIPLKYPIMEESSTHYQIINGYLSDVLRLTLRYNLLLLLFFQLDGASTVTTTVGSLLRTLRLALQILSGGHIRYARRPNQPEGTFHVPSTSQNSVNCW